MHWQLGFPFIPIFCNLTEARMGSVLAVVFWLVCFLFFSLPRLRIHDDAHSTDAIFDDSEVHVPCPTNRTSEVSQFNGNDLSSSIGIGRLHTNRGKL